jgi:hypothetical protein
MENTASDPEKGIEHEPSTEPHAGGEENAPHRAIAFPDDDLIQEERHAPALASTRPKGVEMKRELTKEDKELAAAGYHDIEEKKKKDGKDFDNVDITEHKLEFAPLAEALKTSFDPKTPGASHGLTDAEAKARLAKDGRNILTPPKKKSALRKYFDCLNTMFNILLIVAGVLEYILLGIDYKVSNFMYLLLYIDQTPIIEQFSKYISGCYSHRRCLPQCVHRVLPTSKIGSYSSIIPRYDPPFLSRCQRWWHQNSSC